MKLHKFRLIFSLSLILALLFSISAFSIYGDADNDGYFSTLDAREALLYSAKIKEPTEEQVELLDMNRDGLLTTEDARIILRGASGIDEMHDFTPWTVTKRATCKREGEAVCTCKICGKSFHRTLPKTEHNIVGQTCEKGGICTICGERFEPLGHNYVDGVCTRCGKVLPTIEYNKRKINLGIDKASLVNILGEPGTILNDKINLKNFEFYIYHKDYKNLGVFTFCDNKLTEFYTNSASANLKIKNTVYNLTDITDTKLDDIAVTVYKDSFENKSYSFHIVQGEGYLSKNKIDSSCAEQLNFHLTNGCRAINNLQPLTYSNKIRQVAFDHSLDMAKREYFDHVTPPPESLTPADRIKNAGIKYSYMGENIAMGNGIPNPYYLVDKWYNSKGHRQIMLNTNLTHIGVGIVYGYNSKDICYATQDYFTP